MSTSLRESFLLLFLSLLFFSFFSSLYYYYQATSQYSVCLAARPQAVITTLLSWKDPHPPLFKEELSGPLGSAALSPPPVVIALAPAGNIVVAVSPAPAEFMSAIIFTQMLPATTFTGASQTNPVVLSGLPLHTGAQALSACKRA
ncbi:hypothetical protein CIHG_10153 [Coccidioides immitis H538.4]|uniref:Uncharacterized protein n=1 Tax=Coccidioides immitis H538.4 TaxID=396776 RepID=A0A0J8S5B9_COCIT|nr:hypothetical protein CIHG_10153 [Coccidioides immitis H538.4]